jgi:hypothetical protein
MLRTRLTALILAAAVATGGTGAIATTAASAAKPKPTHVVIGKPNAKPGDGCHKGTAGCGKGGKFTGEFFGG